MKRLGIIVFFSINGKVDQYVDYLILSVQKLFHKFIFIVNGAIQDEDYVRLKEYVQYIVVRENEGYDAGAYKDAFLKYITKTELAEYDEVVLMNDTFYGPFYPLTDIWSKFNDEKVDFWGITRHPKGRFSDGTEMPSHVQGYFLVLKKRLIRSRAFQVFWENMPYPSNIQSAINEFEIRFTTYFEEIGFIGKSFMDVSDSLFKVEDNTNPYLYYNLWMIRDVGVPFLKKKSLFLQMPGYIQTIDSIEYIEKEKFYDTTMIWKNVFRLSKENQFKSVFNYYQLEKFYHYHNHIFIYGAGQYGRNLKRYFEYRKWTFVCFLVSREEDKKENCEKYDDIQVEASDGIILALGKKALKEVYPIVIHDLDISQILIPQI